MKRLTILTALLTVGSCIAEPAFADPPENPSYAPQWSRTQVTRAMPFGRGCMHYDATAATSTILRNPDSSAAVIQLPMQLMIVNTATSVAMVCSTQDVDASFDRNGYFTAEDDATRYAAGKGVCTPVPGGGTNFHGTFLGSFRQSNDSWPVGSNVRSCSVSGAPCEVSGNCPAGSGTCTGPRVDKTYIGIIVPAGSGAGTVYVCEVQ